MNVTRAASTSAAAAAPGLIFVGFNQDAACFGVGTVAGFRVYNTDPLHERARREHIPFFANAANADGGGTDGADGAGGGGAGGTQVQGEIHVVEERVEKDRRRRGDSNASSSAARKGKLPATKPHVDSSRRKPTSDEDIDELDSPPDMDEEDEGTEDADGFYRTEVVQNPMFSPSSSPPIIVEVEDDDEDMFGRLEDEGDESGESGDGSGSGSGREGTEVDSSASPPPKGPPGLGGPQPVPPSHLPPRPELDRPGGITIVEMLYRTNYVALVGGGRNPKFPPNRLIIWDDLKGRVVMQLQFRSEIKAVRLRKDRIIIAFWNRIVVYTFSPRPQRLHTFETMRNDRGLLALSPSPLAAVAASPNKPGTAILAFPGRAPGQVQICELLNGHLLATASETGTLIRVFDVKMGRLVNELRRGLDRAEVFCIAFNAEGDRVVVASDKGTVHVFNVAGGAVGIE
ncbi:WD repeat domain phosphoinositide-interacting protein 3, partial [Irineochytrium annulatum]